MEQSIQQAGVAVHASDRQHCASPPFSPSFNPSLVHHKRPVLTRQTQAGDLNTTTTRFWLALDPGSAFQLLSAYLESECGSENITPHPNGNAIRAAKAAGAKSVMGTFVIRSSDAIEGGTTLVTMKREKVSVTHLGVEDTGRTQRTEADEKGSILHWRAFWWSTVRNQTIEQYIIRGD